MAREEKAKAYDEALKKAKEIKEKIVSSHLSTESCEAVSEYIDTIIPELAESEDERALRIIKKRMCYDPVPISDEDRRIVENWLEKRKESLHIHETCKENANSFTDEDEKIRETLVNEIKMWDEHYKLFKHVSKEKVLAYFEKLNDFQFDYPGLYFYDGEKLHFQGNPAMEENPYDFAMSQQEKQNEPIDPFDTKLFQDGIKEGRRLEREDIEKEQKPAEWSKEDEEMISNIISSLRGYMCLASKSPYYTNHEAHIQKEIEFLNTLPERFALQQSQEWSEEDETCLEDALWCVMKTRHFVAKDVCDLDACQCAERWLKSLRPPFKDREMKLKILKYLSTRCSSLEFEEIEDYLNNLRPSWKPSEEQMEALSDAYVEASTFEKGDILESLYDQLKKL